MAELPALKQLYLRISDSLSDENVNTLRSLLGPEILGQSRVQHATPLDMFNMLEADNKIGKGNLGLLVQLLRSLKKGKLADEAERLEQQQRSEAQAEAEAAAAMRQTEPMSEAHRTLLLRYYPTIYQELDATRVLDHLHQQGVLTDGMREDIIAIPEERRHHRTRRLLDLVLESRDNAFSIFCSALGHAGYRHLMELLTGGQQQLMPPMPMALAIYPGFHGREGFDMPLGEQPHVIIPNQHILTTVYQNEQILQMKMRMRDEELKALYMYQENQVKSLERAKAFFSQESLERRFDELQAKIEESQAIIVSTYRGCVILFLTFESQRKFEHFWGSCASGRLSDTLSELLITEEMRTLEGGDQLVVKTLVLEQDYKAWRDVYRKGEPQTTKDEQVEQVTSQVASLDTSKETEELQYRQKTRAKSIQSVTSTVLSGGIRTSISGRASAGSHMSEGREIAAKYKAAIATLTEGMENLARKLTDMTDDCDQVKKEIQQHYKRLILKLQLEEQEMISKVDRAKRDRKNELLHRKEEMDRELGKTKEDLELCQKTLDSDIIGDTEILTLRQQMETRLHYDQLVLQVTGNRTFGGRRAVTFQPCSLSQVSGGSLSLFAGFSIDIEGPAVESFPCSVTVTPDSIVGLTGKNAAPQIEVTSPQGKTTLIQTTAHSSLSAEGKGQTSGVVRVWGAEWRPQTSGKHTLGVCMGDRRDLGTLTVDVGSNNPVLRFGQKGSQHGQFDRPVDVAVRGDRLYVADTWNQRVQVFDLSGKFCFSFSTAAYPVGLAVQADGTIVMNSCEEVKKFSPSGKLLHIFSLGEYCTDPYGLAVQRDGRIVVTEPDRHSIFLFEADGTLVKQVGGQGQFNQPYFVCGDKEDNIIVSDYGNNRVQVFDNNLNFQHKFGLYGRQPQDMQWPNGLSADSRGNIVLANIGQKSDIGGVEHGRKLQVFRPDGTWVATISSDGDKLNHPCGVAVTEDGHVFVSDTRDHCIRKYRYL